ncbi:3-hydroxybutyryl-CoA dehydrogenase [Paenibacillus sp. L3-i20]|uniref:3-hydroxybutyryl-CoA dehydrogenase n=1 Tax=Paenibacillus sp. L3-i20 TaxID=2905833 RepID=UPI001EE03CF3|nr:3-hydroxybutyryl-CoA dehydrogenase [Paenibacillus sp. L3-i20]GKU78092.1 putative 3-hydroxybutyryl-CoA dehydrogenase [Paenibacillus sp. L3-i20]
MTIHKLMVVGAGQMGCGIVQSSAASGLQVILYDITPARVQQGIANINENVLRDVVKGRRSKEEGEEIVGRISSCYNLEDGVGVDIVIEAISENGQLKEDLFSKLDSICAPNTILASNTSSLSITRLAAATKRPHKVIGMHFMNPVPRMPLVEIIRGLATSDETYTSVSELSRQLGKTPIESGDYPGFVSNRVLMPMINEAIFCVYEGVATPQSVDQMMKLGMNHPMGPLALADFIGLDTSLAIMEVLQQGFGDSKYRPCPLLRQYVHAGWLGRKSGRGFYIYE